MIYTHVLNRGGRGVRSPADQLAFGLESQSGEPEKADRTFSDCRLPEHPKLSCYVLEKLIGFVMTRKLVGGDRPTSLFNSYALDGDSPVRR